MLDTGAICSILTSTSWIGPLSPKMPVWRCSSRRSTMRRTVETRSSIATGLTSTSVAARRAARSVRSESVARAAPAPRRRDRARTPRVWWPTIRGPRRSAPGERDAGAIALRPSSTVATTAESTLSAPRARSSGTAVSRSARVMTTRGAIFSAPCCREESRRCAGSAVRAPQSPSVTADTEPGRLTISVLPRIPETPRDRIARGVDARPAARRVSEIPGASRSITARVASGVTSRALNPVPPVVITMSMVPPSHQSSKRPVICVVSSGTSALAINS